MSTITRWWWVRHAPIKGAEGFVGRTDAAADLSDTAALRRLVQMLPAGALWLTSPLRRARETAHALLAARPRADASVRTLDDLREQDFGDWEGRPYRDLTGDAVDRFWQDPAANAPPNGESFADVLSRVGSVISGVTAPGSRRDVVAVAHAGPIRAALALALSVPPSLALRFEVAPLSLTRLDRMEEAEQRWRVVVVNHRPG